MSVLSGISKADFKTASDGLLELSEEKLRNIMRSEPITDTYHVEQTPFARIIVDLVRHAPRIFGSDSSETIRANILFVSLARNARGLAAGARPGRGVPLRPMHRFGPL
ncbi:unnamed protein product [Pieris macdunnoughi]|uniref:Uncharacterized protein n=1 Tax=Pieris macdunnoughi TaxID=345717 RepID=A0A821YF56_9NEOP|nr:unnamed protein product [Pieris macdunnoughi]